MENTEETAIYLCEQFSGDLSLKGQHSVRKTQEFSFVRDLSRCFAG